MRNTYVTQMAEPSQNLSLVFFSDFSGGAKEHNLRDFVGAKHMREFCVTQILTQTQMVEPY
jgi:hypothetical protein